MVAESEPRNRNRSHSIGTRSLRLSCSIRAPFRPRFELWGFTSSNRCQLFGWVHVKQWADTLLRSGCSIDCTRSIASMQSAAVSLLPPHHFKLMPPSSFSVQPRPQGGRGQPLVAREPGEVARERVFLNGEQSAATSHAERAKIPCDNNL